MNERFDDLPCGPFAAVEPEVHGTEIVQPDAGLIAVALHLPTETVQARVSAFAFLRLAMFEVLAQAAPVVNVEVLPSLVAK